jgi:hypothetical protein
MLDAPAWFHVPMVPDQKVTAEGKIERELGSPGGCPFDAGWFQGPRQKPMVLAELFSRR